MSRKEIEHLLHDWSFWARPDQRAPAGDWLVWLVLGGRGAGKTRTGAEWLRAQMEGATPHSPGRVARAAIVGADFGQVREVMVEGPSGLIAIGAPGWKPSYEATRRRVVWPNGAIAQAFSAAEPDGVRGAQFAAAWCDEFAAWARAEEVWANVRLALRLGARPQAVVTTTPRATNAVRGLLKAKGVAVTRAPTRANAAWLAKGFVEEMEAAYAGTLTARQELDGDLVEDPPGALWTRSGLAAAFDPDPPELDAIVVGLDPPATQGADADACGVVVAGARGEGADRRAWVLADATTQGLSPRDWAGLVCQTARAWSADRVVAEVNQGGAMVGELLRLADPGVVVREVRAGVGKAARAAPVSALYAQGRVRHAGRFPALEDEMCALGAPGGRGSPDRADALVWAVTDLMLGRAGAPRLRRV